jgi:glycerol kinase
MSVLAIDAGTTGVTALLVDANTHVVSRGYREFPQHFPRDGWVEHRTEEIWAATLAAVQEAIAGHSAPTAVGITNQRETVVLWDRETFVAPRPAIVWQDRRSTEICDRLAAAGHGPRVTELTGLRLDPYFSATKLRWLAETEPQIWAQVTSGRVAVGTVDSYLIAMMTAGRSHITDASNASRTLLFDINTGKWSDELCRLFDVPQSALPEVVPSWGVVATTDPAAFLDLSLPIGGIAGDQQAALFGQRCFSIGMSKCTYGTGSFILVNTGETPAPATDGLLSTVAWRAPDGTTTYALEGAVFVTGAAVQWLRDGLGMIESAAESAVLASSVENSGGVVFVPALTGMGAPHWDPRARGLIVGLTRGTTRAHLARATLEAIAFEVRDIVDVMTFSARLQLPELSVDGGASANDLLCQLQADQLQVSVVRSADAESTGIGAALLAGLGTGVWSDPTELPSRYPRVFHPGQRDDEHYKRWCRAVELAKGWAAV